MLVAMTNIEIYYWHILEYGVSVGMVGLRKGRNVNLALHSFCVRYGFHNRCGDIMVEQTSSASLDVHLRFSLIYRPCVIRISGLNVAVVSCCQVLSSRVGVIYSRTHLVHSFVNYASLYDYGRVLVKYNRQLPTSNRLYAFNC